MVGMEQIKVFHVYDPEDLEISINEWMKLTPNIEIVDRHYAVCPESDAGELCSSYSYCIVYRRESV
jgi:Sporulation protein Cse60